MAETDESRATLPLRQFTFFHRNMLVATDTQLSVHTDVRVDASTFAGYMQTTICIMHQHFPGSMIEESFVWEITRTNRSIWAIPPSQLDKLTGDAYDARVHRQKTRVQSWYLARVSKIEPLIHNLVMQMFIDGCVTLDRIEMLVQEKYRPKGTATMIAKLPWEPTDDYQL